MLGALFYKEWIKSRRMVLFGLIVFVGVIVYSLIIIGQTFRIDGSVQAWDSIILNDAPVFPAVLQWIPLLFALSLSCAQFIPEVLNKRLKLTLHLPMSESCIVSATLGYGISVLFIVYVFWYTIIMSGLSFYFPFEIRSLALMKSLPWFLSGVACYFLVAWICIEPLWIQRFFNAFISICILSLFFFKAVSGAYLPLLPFLFILTIICFGLPFYSCFRFKDGQQ